MLQPKLRATVALLGVLATAAASTVASADDRGYYRSEPQIRLGFDVIWGGHAYAPPQPPVAWYPSRRYYEPYRYDYQAERRLEGRGHGHRKHRKHRHHHHDQHWDD